MLPFEGTRVPRPQLLQPGTRVSSVGAGETESLQSRSLPGSLHTGQAGAQSLTLLNACYTADLGTT